MQIMQGLKKSDGLRNGLPPLCPILSAISTCLYNVTKCFVPIRKEFTVNDYTFKDWFSFSSKIRSKDISLYIALFDIQSFVTNLPLDETIEICLELLCYKKRIVKGMLKKHINKLLTHRVKSSAFMCNDVYYKQADGVAMGLL